MKPAFRNISFALGALLLWFAFSSPLSELASRSTRELWQLGHVALFAIWTYLLFPIYARKIQRPAILFGAIILSALAAGLLIEFLQSFLERNFSLKDLVYDLIGCLLALSILLINNRIRVDKQSRQFLYASTLLLGSYAVTPLTLSIIDEVNMYRNFPVLSDFRSSLEITRWQGDIEILELATSTGQHKVLKASLTTTLYSGISLSHFPRDWSDYRYLRFKLYNPDPSPLKLTIRIHDNQHYSVGNGDYHDRFNRNLQIAPGWNDIEVALADVSTAARKRKLDLSRVAAVGLFSTRLPEPRLIYIDDFRLSK